MITQKTGPLSLLLPSEEQTPFLQACLHESESWKATDATLIELMAESDPAVRELMPLYLNTAQRNNVDLNPDVLKSLQAVFFHEELRSKKYRKILKLALAALQSANIRHILLKGAALAGIVYSDWTLRHCHDIDILIKEEDRRISMAALEKSGFLRTRDASQVKHSSGLPVVLHRNLFSLPYYRVHFNDIYERSVEREVEGVSVHVPSPTDMLVHICGHAACSKKRDSLRWVCDAFFVINKYEDLDWDLVSRTIQKSRLFLPLSKLLHYLAEEIHAPVSSSFLKNLNHSAHQSTRIDWEAALVGVRRGRQGTYKALLQNTLNPKDRASILKWIFFPSPTCLRWTFSSFKYWLLPFYYAYRPLRAIWHRLI